MMPGHGGFTVFKSTDNHLWKAKVAGPGARQGIFGDSFLRFNNQKTYLSVTSLTICLRWTCGGNRDWNRAWKKEER